MSGSPKEKLHSHTEEISEEREVYLRDGRKVVIGEQNGEQLVEIRSESGMVELRIKLTDEGPVLQMESARLSLKATEAVAIESRRVEIKATEKLALEGGEVDVKADRDVDVKADGEVHVVGTKIFLN
jgi:hypothetical protein